MSRFARHRDLSPLGQGLYAHHERIGELENVVSQLLRHHHVTDSGQEARIRQMEQQIAALWKAER